MLNALSLASRMFLKPRSRMIRGFHVLAFLSLGGFDLVGCRSKGSQSLCDRGFGDLDQSPISIHAEDEVDLFRPTIEVPGE